MKNLFAAVFLLLAFLSTAAQEKTSVTVLEEAKPVSVGIVVDNSASFRAALDFVIDTTKVIARDIQPQDEASLVRFVGVDRIETVQDLTSDQNSLLLAADDMYCEGGQTAIPEALIYAAKELARDGKNERKVLVLITDGDNRSDKKIYADAISFLKEKKIAVYVVGITMVLERNIGESKKFLERLASDTGGSVVLVERKTSAADAGRAVIKAIREQK
jgi:VWFA-related protein